jgi:hypothetical protein
MAFWTSTGLLPWASHVVICWCRRPCWFRSARRPVRSHRLGLKRTFSGCCPVRNRPPPALRLGRSTRRRPEGRDARPRRPCGGAGVRLARALDAAHGESRSFRSPSPPRASLTPERVLTADRGSEFGYRIFLVFLAIGWLSVGTDAPEQGVEPGIPGDLEYSISDSPLWAAGLQRSGTSGPLERDAFGTHELPEASPHLSSAFRESDPSPDPSRHTPFRTPRLGGEIAPARGPPFLID